MTERDHVHSRIAAADLPVETMPRHVGIIMDGNGRWASARGLPRIEGHRRGVEALRRTIRAAIEMQIRYLTVYSFSSENWSRPAAEIADLMGLLKRYIRNDLADLHQNDVRVRVIGTREGLKSDIASLLKEAEDLTVRNKGLTLVVAFNYGGRQEIAAAARRIAMQVAAGAIDPATVSADLLSQNLDTAEIPDPDLIVRTSGEQRLSNFLVWQAAYAEFVFLPCYWPDFDGPAFESAIEAYMTRERRFGGAGSPLKVKSAG